MKGILALSKIVLIVKVFVVVKGKLQFLKISELNIPCLYIKLSYKMDKTMSEMILDIRK